MEAEAGARPLSREAALAWLGALLVVSTGLRLLWAGSVDLAPDEAYYWTWLADGSWGTRDHPPGVAWLMGAGTRVAGDSALGVRLGAIVAGSVVTLLTYASTLRALELEEGTVATPRRWALLATALVTFSLLPSAGAVIHTPDSGLSAAWLVALYALLRTAIRPEELRWLYIAAVATGVGILFKITMGLFPLCALATLLSVPAGRKLLRTPHPWIAAAMAFAPALLVALTTPSLGFQLSRAAARPGGLVAAAELIGAQALLMTPPVALATAAFLGHGRWRRTPLWWSAVVPLGFFTALSLWTRPEAGWPGVAHAGCIIGAVLWARFQLRRRIWHLSALVLVLVVTVLAHAQAITPMVALPDAGDPTARLSGWSGVGARWGAERSAVGDVPACADHYGLAAELRFYDPQHRPVCTWDTVTPPPPGLFASDRLGCAGARRLRGERPPRLPRAVVVTVCSGEAWPEPLEHGLPGF